MWAWEPPLGVLLSIGTGIGIDPSSRPSRPSRSRSHRRSLLARRSLTRIVQGFDHLLDGEQAWRNLVDQVGDEPSLLRVNACLEGPAPPLDAVEQMAELARGMTDREVTQQAHQALRLFLAQTLFFELDMLPERHQEGPYRCVGSIRCRLPGDPFVSVARAVLPRETVFVLGSMSLGISPMEGAVCDRCSRYCLRVRFSVPCLQDLVTLALRVEDGRRLPLASFPATMQGFIHKQGLDAVFGTPNHGAAARDDCRRCEQRLTGSKASRAAHLRYRGLARASREG